MEALDSKFLEVLKDWSKKSGIPLEELSKKVEEISDRLSEEGSSVPSETILRLVKTYITQSAGSLRSSAISWQGFFMGSSPLINYIDLMVAKARSAWGTEESHPRREEALQKGWVNESGEPLDTRERIFGKDNPNLGRSWRDIKTENPTEYLRQHERSFERRLYGIFKIKGEVGFVFGVLRVQGGAAKTLSVKYWAPCEFRANGEGDPLTLYASNVTRFQEIKTDWDIMGIVRTTCPFTPLNNLADWHLQREKDFNRVVFVEGEVAIVRSMASGDTRVVLESPSLDLDTPGIQVFFPEHIPVEFGPGSRIFVLGTTGQYRRSNDKELITTIRAYGFYPIIRVQAMEDLLQGETVTWQENPE